MTRFDRAIRDFIEADKACNEAVRAGIAAGGGRASAERVRDALVRVSEAIEELAMVYDEIAKRLS